jgi:basic amino acid/polyamine antiporter, APA family
MCSRSMRSRARATSRPCPRDGRLHIIRPVRPTAVVNPDKLLVRGLGTRELTAAIFNYTVGSGIFALPAFAVAQLGGAAPLAFLLCAVVTGLIALVFAEAGSRVMATGGPYAYVGVALGPFAGFIAGVLSIITDVAAVAAVGTLLAGSLMRMIGVQGPAWADAIVTVLIVGLAMINIRGVRAGAAVIEVSTVAKIIPLVAFALIGALFVSPANLRWDFLPSAGRVATTAGTLLFAFSGIEAALLPSGEVRDPSRTVPRAAILALACATVLYIAVQEVGLGILGPALAADRVAPLAAAAGKVAGRTGRGLLLAGAAISMFGWLTGALLAAPRAFFALARDGFLSRRLAVVHPTFRTPHVSIALFAALSLALAYSGTFERLAVLADVSVLALWFLCAIAAWELRRRHIRGDGEPFRTPGGPLVPALACGSIAWVAWQTTTRRELVAVGAVLLISAFVYAFRVRQVRVLAADRL